MLWHRQFARRINLSIAAAIACLLGCAPLGTRTLAPYQPVTVTPLDPTATTLPPPRATCNLAPLDRPAPPTAEAAPSLIESVPPGAAAPDMLALAQVPGKQPCYNQGAAAAAAAQPNPTVRVAPPPVTAPPKKPCGDGKHSCPWFHHCDPPANVPKFRPGVTIAPRELIAPVGSEVILTAAVANNHGTLVAGDPVQWTLSQGGVGEFIELGPRDMTFHPPKKVDSHYALGRTSKSYFRITRGTAETTDDALVLRGQSWASVTSPQEGVSYVTAYAPDEENWDRRKDTAKIYWVDAQWVFPPPAINPAGQPHVFTTFVSRATDQTPIEGWAVRYEILDGPEAGFGPNAVRMIEVMTDANGRADIELVQRAGVEGVNNVQIQIIRPANPAKGETKRLVLGSGITSKQWTGAAAPLAINIQGPTQAQIGQTATYTINVTNPSNSSNAENIILSDQLPAQLAFLSAVPSPSEQSGPTLRWNLGTLSPGQTRQIVLNTRVDQSGNYINCAQVAAAGGAMAQSCVTTTTVQSQLAVDIAEVNGRTTFNVGEQAQFRINVLNRGTTPASNLLLRNSFDPGFRHASANSPIENDRLGTLGPGQSAQIGLTFTIVAPGQLCQTVVVESGDGGTAQSRLCVQANAAAVPVATPAQLSIRHTVDANDVMLGDRVLYTIVVRNEGQTPAQNVTVQVPADSGSAEAPFLKATDTSPGTFEFHGSYEDLSYTHARALQPGEQFELYVSREANRITGRACILATVGAQGIQAQSAEACVRVNEAPRINMSIQELADPITVGQTTGYRVTITNTGTTSARNVRLEISAAAALTFEGEAGASRNPTAARVNNGVIVFDTLAELRPNERLQYEVSMRARQATRSARVEAALYLGTQTSAALTASETTEILQAR